MKLLSIFVVLPFFLFGCSSNAEPEGQVISTVISPSKTIKAFVFEPELKGGLGATVSQPYQVWMQSLRPGMEKEKALVFEADKTDGVRVSWTQEGQLQICYAKAQIGHFRNRFEALDTKNQRVADQIEVVLRRVHKLSDCKK